jgi:hypothetical protein
LTSPLTTNEMLAGKWLGAIVSVRNGWICLGLILALGIVTGGLHMVALVLWIIAWLVYAAVFAGVGVWISAASATSLRATLWTLITVIGLSVGHWLLMGCACYMPIGFLGRGGGGSGDFLEFLAKVEFGQTPPAVLAFLAFHGDEFHDFGSKEMWHLMMSSIFGVFCWGALALALWGIASQRFRRAAGRDPLHRPRWIEAQPVVSERAAMLTADSGATEVQPGADGAPSGLKGARLIEEIRPDQPDSGRSP